MEATALQFHPHHCLTPKKSLQFSQNNLKIRFLSPSNCLIQRDKQYFTNISAIKPTKINRKIISCKSSSRENPETNVKRKKLSVFVSGGGSNFKSIHEASIQGLIHGDVTLLVTDKPGCGGAEYARNNNIPVIIFPKSKSAPEGISTEELLSTLRKHEVDFILLAGYLKLIPVELVQSYPKSILNIHPSLLPAFGGQGYFGLKVHKAVIASGARYSGATVHFVDEEYDTGKPLAQRAVPVLAFDTPERLAARVLKEEHKVYVEAVAALCEERVVWREDGIPLIRSKLNPEEYF
ncbi:hypothetical protein LUZ60_003327 [Juncus effusus]|nr:hypothetical protein LUZ60_003327 [Juncus effusus]